MRKWGLLLLPALLAYLSLKTSNLDWPANFISHPCIDQVQNRSRHCTLEPRSKTAEHYLCPSLEYSSTTVCIEAEGELSTYEAFFLIYRCSWVPFIVPAIKGPSLPYLFFACTVIMRFQQEIWGTCRTTSA